MTLRSKLISAGIMTLALSGLAWLSQAAPVTFPLPTTQAQEVKVTIYDSQMEKVAGLHFQGAVLSQGRLTWEPRDLAPGDYFYRLTVTVDGQDSVEALKKFEIVE